MLSDSRELMREHFREFFAEKCVIDESAMCLGFILSRFANRFLAWRLEKYTMTWGDDSDVKDALRDLGARFRGKTGVCTNVTWK